MQKQFTIEAKCDIKRFQTMIFSWWKTHKRDLPWRHTHDPYKILISEIMLQQTQVSRGLPMYHSFLSHFPTVHALAKATAGEVLLQWKGMGYNRRALYLQSCAKKIVDEYGGIVPDDEGKLRKLPGLGMYTARAILVFALKKDIAMVDTNIRQIISHFFFNNVSKPEKTIQQIADKLLPKGKSWEWHQALMDYGALELVREKKKEGKKKKKTVPFKETKRYVRGRLLDLVREKKWKKEDLVEEMMRQYGKERELIQEIIETMRHDGLIVYGKADIISLPE